MVTDRFLMGESDPIYVYACIFAGIDKAYTQEFVAMIALFLTSSSLENSNTHILRSPFYPLKTSIKLRIGQESLLNCSAQIIIIIIPQHPCHSSNLAHIYFITVSIFEEIASLIFLMPLCCCNHKTFQKQTFLSPHRIHFALTTSEIILTIGLSSWHEKKT